MKQEYFKNYKSNKSELESLEKVLDKLKAKREDIPIVAGKVSKSADEFPYIEQRVTVEMREPRASDEVEERIRKKEARKREVEHQIKAVERFIGGFSSAETRTPLPYLKSITNRVSP